MTMYPQGTKKSALAGNETTAQVLALLSGIAGNELHTNEIIRRIEGNPRAVQRALVKSEAGGLITSRRIGNLRLWRMDPANPLYASMREAFGRTRGVPAKLASVLAKSRGVRVAFLFGSYVTAKDNPTSDIDLFVIGAPDWKELAGALRAAGRQLGRVVNPIIWSETDLAEMPPANREFLDSVMAGPIIWLVGDEQDLNKFRSNVGAGLARRRSEHARVVTRRQSAASKGQGPRGGRQGGASRQSPRRRSHPR
jgi:predicted nucleotidyltransferase